MTEAMALRGLADLYRRTSRLRGYSAVLFALGCVLLFSRAILMPATDPVPPIMEWLPLTALFLLSWGLAFQGIARFLARVPRRHTAPATGHVEAVEEWSRAYGIDAPRVLTCRTGGVSVCLRGWQSDVAIVLSPKGEAAWTWSKNRDDVSRSVQIVHELSHAWARDLRLYFWTRSLSVGAVLLLLVVGYALMRGGASTSGLVAFAVKLIVLIALAFLAGRAYMRYREHVADVATWMVIGKVKVRSELVRATEPGLLRRIVHSHPPREARLAVIHNPVLLLKSERWFYPLLGLAGGFFASALAHFIAPVAQGAGLPEASGVWVVFAFMALWLTRLLPHTMLEQAVFRSKSFRDTFLHAFLLFAGLQAGLLLLNPLGGDIIPDVQLLPLAIAAAVTIAAAVVTTGGMLLTILAADDGEETVHGWVAYRGSFLIAVLGVLLAARLLLGS